MCYRTGFPNEAGANLPGLRGAKQAATPEEAFAATHAHVAFAAVGRPCEVEATLLSSMSLPLNLSGNGAHAFAVALSRTRPRGASCRGRQRRPAPV